mmetsp:Transcript_5584/g.11362  ORF Transcript_5584/g.11362 Transcript_5584/m.11362 type:complete len:331 (+) Transcript_5584:344-1336(+)
MQGFGPSQRLIARHLAGAGTAAVAKGAALGLLSPLCSCGALPMAAGLAAAGAAAPAVVAYIVAAQSAGVDSLIFTLGVLGPKSAAARMAAAAAAAMVTGLAVPGGSSGLAAEACRGCGDKGCREEATKDPEPPARTRVLRGFWEAGTSTFDEVAPAVLFGFIVTAALVALMPQEGLGSAAALGGLGGRMVVLLLTLPLQFCEHAAVPLAIALQKAGASGGLAFAALATVPALNLASLGVVATLAGTVGAARAAAGLWLGGVAGSFAADALGLSVVRVGHGEGALPEWYERASLWAMGAISMGSVLRFALRRLAGGNSVHCCGSEGARTHH